MHFVGGKHISIVSSTPAEAETPFPMMIVWYLASKAANSYRISLVYTLGGSFRNSPIPLVMQTLMLHIRAIRMRYERHRLLMTRFQ